MGAAIWLSAIATSAALVFAALAAYRFLSRIADSILGG